VKIVAHENVLNRMSAVVSGKSVVTVDNWPTDTFFDNEKEVYFNGEAVILYHEPNAHTDGDSVILFRGSDVVATGDIFSPDSYPFIDIDRGLFAVCDGMGGHAAGEVASALAVRVIRDEWGKDITQVVADAWLD